MCTIESNLKATANNEIEAIAKSTIALNTKLRNAIDARYFRDRSRSRLNEFKKISDSDFCVASSGTEAGLQDHVM
jgi:hypothetical protein